MASKPIVDFIKGSEEDVKAVASMTDAMNSKVTGFFLTLVPSSSDSFDVEKSYKLLSDYLEAYGRLLYSTISSTIYNVLDCYRESQDDICSAIVSRVEALIAYSETDSTTDKNIVKKTLVKLWDHVNLASQHYINLKQTDDEYSAKFEVNFKNYKEEVTKDMSSQLLTMVSIFTALAFLVFGSISSLDNIFSVSGIPVLKAMLTGIIWGLCVLNLVFVFLYCVSKMTNLKIMTSGGNDASVFKRYPLVFWVNFLLLSLLLVCSWLYFLQINSASFWNTIFPNGFKISVLIGSISVIVIILVAGYFLSWLTGIGEEKECCTEKSCFVSSDIYIFSCFVNCCISGALKLFLPEKERRKK